MPRQANPLADTPQQFPLWETDASAEDPDYLARQLITYIGNKRALLRHIGTAVDQVKRRTGKRRLRVFDAFSGSGVVSRFLKAHASYVATNDLEDYAAVVGRCYLRNRSEVDAPLLARLVQEMNANVATSAFAPGFIEELYSPKDEANIRPEDRVFYTKENARRLDNYRRMIAGVPKDLHDMLLAPLISKASIHANTAGVFKGFYKSRETGAGHFGGSGSDALLRIRGEIQLELPILSRFECEYEVFQEDANTAFRKVRDLDLTYVDPPYNQHPYGSNYFMLNLLVGYQRPAAISAVSGIPTDWKRSGYNVRSKSLPLLRQILEGIDSRFLLISFNNEGFISPEAMRAMLAALGSVEVFETTYNAFRGSRNFTKRPLHVTEQLFLVERK